MWLGNEKKPMKKNPDRLQELKNDIRGEILLKVSSRVPAHTIISLWFWSGDANHKPACASKSGRSCREKGQTAERLQMATLRRRGTFDAQEVKDSLFFFSFLQFLAVQSDLSWGQGSGTTSGFAHSLKPSTPLLGFISWAKFRPPELVGRLCCLTDVGRQSSSPDRGGDKRCTFPGIPEVQLNWNKGFLVKK